MPEKNLKKVILRADIYHVLLAHALSTEKEEIMGMLLGDWNEEDEKNPEAIITSVMILTRSDKRKDRVEIAPEQLHLACIRAEEIEKKTKVRTRVIGWYHSHPHITVFPSHIDLRTQFSQQLLDPRFFGIILSCFNSDGDQSNRIQICCFQANSVDDNIERIEIPLQIKSKQVLLDKGTLKTFTEIPKKIFEEGQVGFKNSNNGYDDKLRPSERITYMYNSTIYMKSLCQWTDNVVGPMCQVLEQKCRWNLLQIEHLKRKREVLLKERKPLVDI